MKQIFYSCPMHPEVREEKPGKCPRCGMTLIPKKTEVDYSMHDMNTETKTSFWEKFKMSMTMSMGMDHTGLAGREMAKIMEVDIRNKFFISLILTIPIVIFTYLTPPFKREWFLFILTTPVYFYCGWIYCSFYSDGNN